jgi:hypothetical protein
VEIGTGRVSGESRIPEGHRRTRRRRQHHGQSRQSGERSKPPPQSVVFLRHQGLVSSFYWESAVTLNAAVMLFDVLGANPAIPLIPARFIGPLFRVRDQANSVAQLNPRYSGC